MPAQDDYEAIEGMADRLGLEGDERGKYVTEHMQRFGYKPRTVWEDNDEEEEGGDVSQGFFGGGKKTAAPKRTREVGKKTAEPKRSNMYGYGD